MNESYSLKPNLNKTSKSERMFITRQSFRGCIRGSKQNWLCDMDL